MEEVMKHRNGHHHNDFDIADDVAKIKAAIFETGRDLKGKASEMITGSVDDVKDYTSSIKDNVVDYTSEKPLKSLGIALLVGVVLGFLIRK